MGYLIGSGKFAFAIKSERLLCWAYNWQPWVEGRARGLHRRGGYLIARSAV